MKHDVAKKIPFSVFIRALFSRSPEPHVVLQSSGVVSGALYPSYFSSGRAALQEFIKTLNVKQVGVPAYICPSVIQAIQKAGKKALLLDVDPGTFTVEVSKIPKKLECLLAVHTLGNYVDLNAVKARSPDIIIVEDCAHCLSSFSAPTYTGSQAVLYSLYKVVPNFKGALLFTKEPLLSHQNGSMLNVLPQLLSKIEGPHQLLVNRLRRGMPYRPGVVVNEETHDSGTIEDLIKKIFSLSYDQWRKDKKKRLEVRNWYRKQLLENPYYLIQKATLGKEVDGYLFGIRLKPEFAKYRDRIVRSLRRRGVFVEPLWWEANLEPGFAKRFPQADLLARSVIALPIDSRYREADSLELVHLLLESTRYEISHG